MLSVFSIFYAADTNVFCGILSDENILSSGHGVYSALQCLRNCCKDKDLIHPDRLTSTGYRAYMATIARVND